MDIETLFGFQVNPLELVLRASAFYWFLLLAFRFLLRRDMGSLTVGDLLLVVLVADAAQNGMAGDYRSISEGALVVGTLIAWNYGLDALAFRWPVVRRLLEAPPLLLIRQGRVHHRNLRREKLTLDDLQSQARQAGIDDLGRVRAAYLEGDGKFSFIPVDDAGGQRTGSGEPPGV